MSTEEPHAHHPETSEYIQIGVVLFVLTGIEVSLYFAGVAKVVAVPLLLVLTAMKFMLVGFWFMHLRFDNPIFRRLFFAGTLLAIVCFGIVGAVTEFGPA